MVVVLLMEEGMAWTMVISLRKDLMEGICGVEANFIFKSKSYLDLDTDMIT